MAGAVYVVRRSQGDTRSVEGPVRRASVGPPRTRRTRAKTIPDISMRRRIAACCVILLSASADGFLSSDIGRHPHLDAYAISVTSSQLHLAKTKAKKKKKKLGKTGGGGLKGFGGSKSSSVKSSDGVIDRSKSALKFYEYLSKNGAEANLKRVGLGYFPLKIDDDTTIQLRGVIALKDISKGDSIIEIPYEMALDLGRESADPTLPATAFLQKYCAWRSGADVPPGDKGLGDYFDMLPPFLSNDCLGSTDFFRDSALDMLQSPMVKEETLERKKLVKLRYERDIESMSQMSSNLYQWDGEAATEEHLQWASWIITSRVLTVQGPPESSFSNRLLIPLIDMCNHSRESPHILTGRAMPGGLLKVVAGVDVKAGDAIDICYGGGVEGNDRFVQDYGFLDSSPEAYKIVAKKLLGKGRSIAKMTAAEQELELLSLEGTTLEEDESLLANCSEIDERAALDYRIGIKNAIRRLRG